MPSDLRLPNLDGVSDVDFKKLGFINVIKEGGRKRPEQKLVIKSKKISLDTSSQLAEEPKQVVKTRTKEFLGNLKKMQKIPS